VGTARLDRASQRSALPEDVLLADDLTESPGPHARRERRVGPHRLRRCRFRLCGFEELVVHAPEDDARRGRFSAR
jgi:hypothetical protein